MKKILKSFLTLSAVLGSMSITSCMGDGTNSYSNSGFFTAVQESGSFTFYRDFGGAVRFNSESMQSLNAYMKERKGLKDGDRFMLFYTYKDNAMQDVQGKGILVNNAEVNQALYLEKNNILTQSEAESKNILVSDSVFSMKASTSANTDIMFHAYRGYLTAQYTGAFSTVVKDDKNTVYVSPSLYLIMDPAENLVPNILNLKMSYNRHTSKTDTNVKTGSTYFYTTYSLSNMANYISGKDSISVNIEGPDLKSTVKFRIGRQDLTPSNYIYFQN